MGRENEVQGRLQVKRAEQKRKAEERAAELDSLKHSYARIKDEPAFQDILEKAKSYAAYHTKMAKDGVGYRDTGRFDDNNKAIQEIVYYDQPKRLSELDKAAGIEELEDYIKRQITSSIKAAETTEAAPVAGDMVAESESDDDAATDETVA